MEYSQFLNRKSQIERNSGFDPIWIPDDMFDFQKYLTEWTIRKGRAANFADCGLGKTYMQLVTAENVVRHTNGNVLIVTPLAVSSQTVSEGEKFGIEVKQSRDGKAHRGITVTNYEKLHLFDRDDFVCLIPDESGILKNFDSSTKNMVVEFSKKMKYRYLFTATAAPNDYIELGNSSETLGYLGFIDMLSMFFKKNDKTSSRKDEFRTNTWRFKGHSEKDFWRWVCSWARAIRKPSDYGFDDGPMTLPALNMIDHRVESKSRPDGFLFDMPAKDLPERRAENNRTIVERCEKAAEIANSHNEQVVLWCHLNKEGSTLRNMVDGAVEVNGSQKDELKEERLKAFADGEIRALVTKPKIAGFGMNFQNCNRMVYFPDDSYEKLYQSSRRAWRFGQKRDVTIDLIYTRGLESVLNNLKEKSKRADRMFEQIVKMMKNEMKINRENLYTEKMEAPSWL